MTVGAPFAASRFTMKSNPSAEMRVMVLERPSSDDEGDDILRLSNLRRVKDNGLWRIVTQLG